ncbi:hypothetical protein PspLS_01779 [Pyricularia sp. CBS 133598]|nr:hypothetical protein PspLS_01779 [Pyricularia sp. CBS 133598]
MKEGDRSHPGARRRDGHLLFLHTVSRQGGVEKTWNRSALSQGRGFALYRALLKQVPDIVLPAETTSFPGDRVNPVKHLIRQSFRRNKTAESARIVVSSLTNGYKYLHLLNGAKTADSPEHKSVVDLIQRNTLRRKPPTPRKEPMPEPPRKHLLTMHPNPRFDPEEWFRPSREPRFFYTPTDPPRQAHELGGSGIRRVPYLVQTSSLDPFLRMKKPQPMSLGRSLQRRARQKQRQTDLMTAFGGSDMRMAELEDEWEDLVAGGRFSGAKADGGATFVQTIEDSVMFLNRLEGLASMDRLQRAAALNEIENRERKLAEEEAAAREKNPKREATAREETPRRQATAREKTPGRQATAREKISRQEAAAIKQAARWEVLGDEPIGGKQAPSGEA